MTDKTQEQTDFGFQRVDQKDKNGLVADLFNRVSKKYDLMNDLLSFGIHRYWKRFTIKKSNCAYGEKVLDVAGGTGDLSSAFSDIVGEKGCVALTDINDSMLKVGRHKLQKGNISNNIKYIQANAEVLPFYDEQFDLVTISFGLRNVTNKENALNEILRVLKPGGRLLILEFSTPIYWPVRKFYDFYCLHILPKLAKLFVNDKESYLYLAQSIQIHPAQEEIKAIMENIGYKKVKYDNLTAGIVALHIGFKEDLK